MSLYLKKLRLSVELSPLLPPDEADLLLDPTTWVRGKWLNMALGEVCLTQGSKVCLVDSCEMAYLASTAGSGHQLRNDTSLFGPANVAQSRLIVIPINIGNSHWVLGVIDKQGVVSIGLHDSLPSQENLHLARETLSHFARAYLPSISAHHSTVTPLMTPLQPNTNDCGCFVFAVALFTLAGNQAPVTLHSGLWRRIMVSCLGSEVRDWHSLIPVSGQTPADVTKYEPPEESFVGLSGLEKFKAQRSHMKKWEEEMEAKFEKQLQTNTELFQTLRSNTVMAMMVVQQLARVGERTEQDLGSELEVAKELEAMKVIPPRGQSSCALSSKIDRVKRTVWCLKATQMSLSELDGNIAKAESDPSGEVDNRETT
ncbi:hypothetical protein LX32DRAFT_44210 [Colletotrichum zoysiae]|uniref:Ubiquitin-like protease family profile domain-containing protein n=1 Tax=Colletotrichum zoysiae TaxID=1216348 RepID=A0AAD9M1E8_9PEZI|nr:hypothetical protein LX32DRAFT_44210 [Colletotrichum zoysiae]